MFKKKLKFNKVIKIPNKVILDTNILFAGSIIETTGLLGFKIKHTFYECSNKLINYLKKNVAKRIGIITNTIENQAYITLAKAVEDELKKHLDDIESEFHIFSVLLNICNDNMRNILKYLIREPIDESAVREIYRKINNFYDDLMAQANEISKELNKIVSSKVKRTPKKFRRLAKQIYPHQERWKYAQLLHLLYKEIEYSDKWILSETIYLDRIYKPVLGHRLNTFIASTDYHFSPIRKDNKVSSIITDEIYRRFNIKCDWPDKICDIIRK